MLGRRAAVAVSTLAVATIGSGVALAATHGSQSPKQPTAPQHQTRPSQSKPTMSGHHCPNMGTPSSTAAASL